MKNINKYTILSSQNNKNLEKDIIVLEKMNKSDNSNNKPSKPKQQKTSKIDLLIQQFGEFRNEVNTRFDNIETIQLEQGKKIDKIEAKLEEHSHILKKHSKIFERNNLK
ncbi:MAG: hypothetical protein LBD05_02755 [Mycoplasmataceae bacterium]|jgi:hypothetical protein|nr:hypothetical protein [Mycoplasmataceae bacterium]